MKGVELHFFFNLSVSIEDERFPTIIEEKENDHCNPKSNENYG
jgi:hypothetical protein